MNCLGVEGREIKVKVAKGQYSDMKNFGTPYLLHALKDFNRI